MSKDKSKAQIDSNTQTARVNLICGPVTIRGFEKSIEWIEALNKELSDCRSLGSQMRNTLVSILKNSTTPGKYGSHYKLISTFVRKNDSSVQQTSTTYLTEAPFALGQNFYFEGSDNDGAYTVNIELQEHNVQMKKEEKKKPKKRERNQK